jgi:hypothetical protein
MMNSGFDTYDSFAKRHLFLDIINGRYQSLMFTILTLMCLSSTMSKAQELEPRALTNIACGHELRVCRLCLFSGQSFV